MEAECARPKKVEAVYVSECEVEAEYAREREVESRA